MTDLIRRLKTEEPSDELLAEVLALLSCADYRSDAVKWWLEHKGVIQRAKTIDIIVRKDAVEYRIEGDFLKPLARLMAERLPQVQP